MTARIPAHAQTRKNHSISRRKTGAVAYEPPVNLFVLLVSFVLACHAWQSFTYAQVIGKQLYQNGCGQRSAVEPKDW